jgi:tetratricopeptide (TPR) repeat protein
MRALILFAVIGVAAAQSPDPAYEPLARGYEALKSGAYEPAVSGFLKGIELAPGRASIRKDLAYLYLKIGENVLAREQFRQAMELDPADLQTAKEYAFLCHETGERQTARRVFDRVRKSGDAVAEQAFQNIDAPLAAGIERWTRAIAAGASNFSAHYELAKLAEERDSVEIAAEHYERAWRLTPERRSVLVDLGRVWKALGRDEDSNAALLAARWGGEPRAAEMARELLPVRYPYVAEFQRALALDPGNTSLRRELAYLLLQMDLEERAVEQFQALASADPNDMLSATQLAFLLHARGDSAAAQPLFDRVLAGQDHELANRVRAVLRMEQEPAASGQEKPAAVDAREMAERSVKAGFLKDALRYFQMAHQADPFDTEIILRLAWTFNMLQRDVEAIQWFGFARRSSDPRIAKEAEQAWRNLRRGSAPFQTSFWMAPMYSTRWRDLFGYSQVRTEWRAHLPVQPFISLRFVGDQRREIRDPAAALPPRQLSESSVIPAVGVHTPVWHGVTLWAEAGIAAGYLSGHFLPDFRGGVSTTRRVNSSDGSWFGETALDAVFVSRFGNDILFYERSRLGRVIGSKSLRREVYWNVNLTGDNKREGWANFWETGPGVRLSGGPLPKGASVTIDWVRGGYLVGEHPRFGDVRIGFWHAGTR